MKCQVCGEAFEGQGVEDTRFDPLSRAPCSSRPVHTVAYPMCPKCAESRSKTKRMFFWAFLFAIGALSLIAFLMHW